MIATDTFTVNITENDEDFGLGLILYVFNLVGVSGESFDKNKYRKFVKKTIRHILRVEQVSNSLDQTLQDYC
jgi:hypothetical protein